MSAVEPVEMEVDADDSSKSTVVGASNPFLQLFWQLAEEDDAVRSTAEEALVTSLITAQSSLEALSPDPLAPNLRYSLKRLFRGLCSSRGQARPGFSSALASIISAPALNLSLEILLPLMTTALTPPTSPSKQEQTDHKLGFAHAVLVLCKGGKAASLTPTDVSTFVQRLLSFEPSKVLRETAWRAVEELMNHVPWKAFKDHIEPHILTQLATVKREVDDEEEDEKVAGAAADDNSKEEERRADDKGSKSKKTAQQPKKGAKKDDIAVSLIELNTLTPERLSVLLAILHHYQLHSKPLTSLSTSLSPSALKPLSPSTFPILVEVLSSAAYTLPTLHSAYTRVFSDLLSSPTSDWLLLYSLLASTLFSERSSNARKHQGLLMFNRLLELLPTFPHHPLPESVHHLFHPLLLRTLFNTLPQPSTHLHSQAHASITSLIQLARSHPSIVLPVLSGLGAGSGRSRFDAATKTKTVATLVGFMTREDLGIYVDGLIKTFQEETEEAKTAVRGEGEEEGDVREKQCLWVLDQLYNATKHSSLIDSAVSSDNSATERALQFFLFYAFFDATAASGAKGWKKANSKSTKGGEGPGLSTGVCKPLRSPLPAKVREVCQTRLWALLDDLLPRPKGKLSPHQQKEKKKAEKKKQKIAAKPLPTPHPTATPPSYEADDESSTSQSLWALKAHQYWNVIEALGFPLLSPLTDEGRKVRSSMLKIVEEVEERRKKSIGGEKGMEEMTRERLKKERALSLLMLHLGLLQLTEEATITPLLQELDLGYHQVWSKKAAQPQQTPQSKKPKKGKAKEEREEEEEGPQPVFVEVLVDILLSLLVKPSALIRTLARLVFVAFAGDVNESALSDVLRVVTRKSGLHQKKTGDAEDEEDDEFQPFDVDDVADEKEDADEDEDEEKLPSQSSTSSATPLSKKRKRAETDEGSDSSSDDELVDLDMLNELLITPLTPAEQASVDSASASFDHYDHHLSHILQLRQQGKKAQQSDLIAQQLNFQLRVMDLLEVYVRVEGKNRLVIDLVIDRLLDGVEATRKTDRLVGLHDRMVGLVHKIGKSKEHPTVHFSELKVSKAKGKGKKAKVVEEEKGGNEALVDGAGNVMEGTALQRVMTALMERARRAVDSEVLSLISLCLLHLIRISLPPPALISPATHPTLPPAVLSHLHFSHSLYHTALTSYLSHRHSRLNSKFFSDFLHSAPALAWLSAPTIAVMADTPVGTEGENGKEGDSLSAANGFLRNDCFVWLGELFGRKDLLSSQPKEEVESLVRAIARAVESSLTYSTLDEATKAQLKESQHRSTEPSAMEVEGTVEKVGLSKEERAKMKLKEKKRRRRQRQKAALPSVKAGTTAAEGGERKAELKRLRGVLRTGVVVTAQCKRMGLGVGVLTEGVMKGLKGLKEEEVKGLRGDLVNLLKVGGVEELDVMRRAKQAGEERKRLRVQERQKAEKQRKVEEMKERQQQRKVKEEAATQVRALKVQQQLLQKQQQRPKEKVKENGKEDITKEGKEEAETQRLEIAPVKRGASVWKEGDTGGEEGARSSEGRGR